QLEETRAAIQKRGSDRDTSFRVIPVILPGATARRIPLFLAATSHVDFRRGSSDSEALRRLECGIRGTAPGATPRIKERGKVKVEITVEGNNSDFSKVSKAAEEFLQKASGDATLIIRYYRAGSVVIVVECSKVGYEALALAFRD